MSRGAVLAGLVLAVAVAIAVSLRFGAVGLGWSGVLEGLSGDGDPIAIAITRDLRLPRAVQDSNLRPPACELVLRRPHLLLIRHAVSHQVSHRS